MKELIRELEEWKRTHYDSDRQECGSKAFDEILARAKSEQEQDTVFREKLKSVVTRIHNKNHQAYKPGDLSSASDIKSALEEIL